MSQEQTKYWFDPIDTARRSIRGNANRLFGLSDAFHRIGNDKLADELEFIASTLKEAEDIIGKAVHKEVCDSAQQAEQATTNMVMATLAALTHREKGDSND